MDVKITNASLYFVLFCVFIEIRPICGPPVTPISNNTEQLQMDYAKVFKFLSAAPLSRHQGGFNGNTPKKATGTKTVIQQTPTLSAAQIDEIEQRTRNNPSELNTQPKFRLTPDIFGPICLDKMTPEALSDVLTSTRPRINLWTCAKAVRYLQAELPSPMRPSGLIVDKTRGYLAAIPDGLIGDRGVVKVIVTQLMREDLDNLKNFLDNELSQKKDLYYEIQGLLAITDREECVLVVVSKEFIKTARVITRNREFWNSMMMNKIENLCTKSFLPEQLPNQRLGVSECDRETLREKARELLTCDVCFEVIQPPYKVCRNGHLLCHACWPQLQRLARDKGEWPKCPTCREQTPPRPSRCLALEAICNHIDPEMSPPPVVRPDDPMEGSFGSTPQSPSNLGRAELGGYLRELLPLLGSESNVARYMRSQNPPGQNDGALPGDGPTIRTSPSLFPERMATPPDSPSREIGERYPGSPGTFSYSYGQRFPISPLPPSPPYHPLPYQTRQQDSYDSSQDRLTAMPQSQQSRRIFWWLRLLNYLSRLLQQRRRHVSSSRRGSVPRQ